MELLSADAITTAIEGTDWALQDNALVKAVRRNDFRAALEYVNAVGALAEEIGHHPDIDVRWNTVTLRLSTHSMGGVTDADVTLARSLDTLG